ncbi:MAG: hypothetical protein NTY69_02710 [Methylococcales bacterium]|nr:hypothetical protein [Methylococcales bacterium]
MKKLFLLLTYAFLLSACQSINISKETNSDKNSASLFNLLDPDINTEKQALLKGQQELDEGRTDNALFYFIKALQFNHKNINTLEKIAAIHEQNKNIVLAVRVYSDILKLDDKNPIANEYLGLYFVDLGQRLKAKHLLEKAVLSNRCTWRVENALGVISDIEKRYPEAIKHYELALNQESSSPLLMNNIGYSFYLAGDKIAARQYLEEALKLDNGFQRAINNLALIEVSEGHYDRALTLFNRIMPNYESYNNIGYLCLLNKKYEYAEKYLQMAINQSPVYFLKANENLKSLRALSTH